MGILKDIKPIESSGTTPFIRRDMIREYVETPLVGCAEIFYDKNIRTLDSSCNQKDENAMCGIGIAYFQLSDENKKIAQKIVKKYKGDCVIGDSWYCQHNGEGSCSLLFPTKSFESITQISAFFEELASQFKEQDLMYGMHTFDEIREIYANEVYISVGPEDVGIALTNEQREEYLANGVPQEIVEKIVAKEKELKLRLLEENPKYFSKEKNGILYIYESTILTHEDVLDFGYVYDKEQDVYWESQELYDKHVAFLNKEKNAESEINL